MVVQVLFHVSLLAWKERGVCVWAENKATQVESFYGCLLILLSY